MADQHADWWATWWERDYSWEGLAALKPDGTPVHPWEGWIVLADGSDAVRIEPDPETHRYNEYKSDKVPVPDNARLATLQDYWRDQAHDLIPDPTSADEEGKPTRHFTRFHLPLNWQDETPTGKAEWNETKCAALNDLIGVKMQDSAETAFNRYGNLEGPDRRVQFQGGAFPGFNADNFHDLPTEPDVQPSPVLMNWRSDFAFFSGNAGFDGATFSGDAGFYRATFSGNAGFYRATFSGNAEFDGATFSGAAGFYRATFSGNAEFDSVTFSGNAGFDSATFSGVAWFNSAAFSGSAGFDSATFSGAAGFNSATFSSFAGFNSATFSGIAGFDSATFSGNAGFRSATFSGNAWFDSATFSGDVWFDSAIFSGNVKFDSATFSGNAEFNSSIFVGFTSFKGDGVSFTVEPFQMLAMTRAEEMIDDRSGFHRTDKFVRSPENAAIATRAFKGADFTDAVFLGPVDFNNRDFTEATSFKRAQFFRTVSFHGGRLHQGVSFHDARFEDALHRDRQCKISKTGLLKWWTQRGGREWPKPDDDVLLRLHSADEKGRKARRDFSDWLSEFEAERTEDVAKFRDLPKRRQKEDIKPDEGEDDEPKSTQEDYFEELEACFRTLKLAMEDKRDRIKEGEFFQLELKARRRRRKPGVHFWERIISDLYGMTSQYGNSAVLPVYWIAGSLFVFGLIYALQGSSSLIAWDWNWPSLADLGQAMSYSAGRIFGFGPWNAAPEACTPMANLLNLKDSDGQCGWGYWTAFGIKAQATLQTLSAIILVFLSGLAVRRRFQIN